MFLIILYTNLLYAEETEKDKKVYNIPMGVTYAGINHGNGFPAEGLSPGITIGFFFYENTIFSFDYSYMEAKRYPDLANAEIEGEFIDFSIKRAIPLFDIGYLFGGIGGGIVNMNVYMKGFDAFKKRYVEGFIEGGFEIYLFSFLSANMTMRQRLMGLIARSGSANADESESEDVDVSTYTMSASFGLNFRYNFLE